MTALSIKHQSAHCKDTEEGKGQPKTSGKRSGQWNEESRLRAPKDDDGDYSRKQS